MEWLTNYINIYYMLTFMATCFFIFNRTKLLNRTSVNAGWWTLIIGAVTGLISASISKTITPEILITTFTVGTSFYELIIKWVLEKLGWQEKKKK